MESEPAVRRGDLGCGLTVTLLSISGFPDSSAVKNLPVTQELQVQSLAGEDPLEKRMATDSSILAWKTSMNKGAWLATVYVVTESDMTEQLTYTHTLKSPLDCKEIKPVNPKGNQS